jgi:hypothetical protein
MNSRAVAFSLTTWNRRGSSTARSGSLLRSPVALSNIAKRSIASSATINAAVSTADLSCTAFDNFQHRKQR